VANHLTKLELLNLKYCAMEINKELQNWWLQFRPALWSEQEHLENPTINTTSTADANLAAYVAELIVCAGNPVEQSAEQQCNIADVSLSCPCCDGTGYCEGEHYDDLQACLTCGGSGHVC
jgi:hypothetical protein